MWGGYEECVELLSAHWVRKPAFHTIKLLGLALLV